MASTQSSSHNVAISEREPLIPDLGGGSQAPETVDDDEAIDEDFEYQAAGVDAGGDYEVMVRSRHSSEASLYRNSSYYRIDEIIEMGKMATLFFNRTGILPLTFLVLFATEFFYSHCPKS